MVSVNNEKLNTSSIRFPVHRLFPENNCVQYKAVQMTKKVKQGFWRDLSSNKWIPPHWVHIVSTKTVSTDLD